MRSGGSRSGTRKDETPLVNVQLQLQAPRVTGGRTGLRMPAPTPRDERRASGSGSSKKKTKAGSSSTQSKQGGSPARPSLSNTELRRLLKTCVDHLPVLHACPTLGKEQTKPYWKAVWEDRGGDGGGGGEGKETWRTLRDSVLAEVQGRDSPGRPGYLRGPLGTVRNALQARDERADSLQHGEEVARKWREWVLAAGPGLVSQLLELADRFLETLCDGRASWDERKPAEEFIAALAEPRGMLAEVAPKARQAAVESLRRIVTGEQPCPWTEASEERPRPSLEQGHGARDHGARDGDGGGQTRQEWRRHNQDQRGRRLEAGAETASSGKKRKSSSSATEALPDKKRRAAGEGGRQHDSQTVWVEVPRDARWLGRQSYTAPSRSTPATPYSVFHMEGTPSSSQDSDATPGPSEWSSPVPRPRGVPSFSRRFRESLVSSRGHM